MRATRAVLCCKRKAGFHLHIPIHVRTHSCTYTYILYTRTYSHSSQWPTRIFSGMHARSTCSKYMYQCGALALHRNLFHSLIYSKIVPSGLHCTFSSKVNFMRSFHKKCAKQVSLKPCAHEHYVFVRTSQHNVKQRENLGHSSVNP